MRLDNIDLLRLMPPFMRIDKTTIALCECLIGAASSVAYNANAFVRSLLIDSATEEFLNILAQEENITWYDMDASISVKREILKNAPWIKEHLGTPAAVQTTVADYFGDAIIEEWPEYSGQPYHFRVITSNPRASEEDAFLFTKAVEATKNARSYLDAVIIDRAAIGSGDIAAVYAEAEGQELQILGG